MRKLLNTLYVNTQDAYLARDGETVQVRIDREVRFQIPIHNLEGIVVFGHSGVSPALIGLCAERGVALTFLTEHGRFLARLVGPISGNVLLRRRQYHLADDPAASLCLASAFVTAKIANARSVLRRCIRDHEHAVAVRDILRATETLTVLIGRAQSAQSIDDLRGIEGEAARTYFSVFDHLITDQKSDFFFRGRSRRPPLDRVNALLSFVYTLLLHDTRSALEAVGLDPAVGFLHKERPGRMSLALDAMEELRPSLADRLVLSLINRRQVTAKGFVVRETGAVTMDEDTRKTVLVAWQKRKQEKIRHPYLNENILVGLLPYAQSLLLARFLREDLDGYPPFFWK